LTGRIDAVFLMQAIDQLPVGVVVVDASGRIVRVNARACQVLGRDRTGETVAWSTPLGRSLRTGEQVVDELVELERPDGTLRKASVRSAPLVDADGNRIGAIATVDDLSERVEREFISNAAHELRTPLAAISSAVEVLQQGAKDVEEERDRFLEHIARESARLQRLARSLLVLARLEVHAEEPRIEIVPVGPLLSELADGVTPSPGVTVSVRCPRDVAVLANRDLLDHALVNVLANAVRYTHRGAVTLTCRAEGEVAVISVSDTGRGVPASDVDHVFERFFRAGGRDAQGFGLGLSIARRAVEAVGGAIRMTSEEGKGTTVEIRLVLARMVQT
jgi:signal transduction histidine kinase